MKKLLLDKVYQKMGMNFHDYESFLEYLYDTNKSYNLDLFPFYIDNVNKYNQIEVFYQKFLDKCISKNEFENAEMKFHILIRNLWLYNDVFVKVNDSYETIKKSYYFKKNKRLMSKALKYDSLNDSNSLYLVDDLADLDSLLYLATREATSVLMFFEQYSIILLLYGCSGLVYFIDDEIYESILGMVRNSNLYLIHNENIID